MVPDFGLDYARRSQRRRGRLGDTWYLDGAFVKIQGQQQYLWRPVDEDGDLIDFFVQSRRHRRAAIRFFRQLLTRPNRYGSIASEAKTSPRSRSWMVPGIPRLVSAPSSASRSATPGHA